MVGGFLLISLLTLTISFVNLISFLALSVTNPKVRFAFSIVFLNEAPTFLLATLSLTRLRFKLYALFCFAICLETSDCFTTFGFLIVLASIGLESIFAFT